MAKLFGDSTMNVLLQNETLSSSGVLQSLWCPNSSSPSFHGSKSMVNFDNGNGGGNAERQFFQSLEKDEMDGGDYEGCFQQPGKKRRLTVEQVEFLERNFEIENKLEPERKVQLAKELGLQPRQVAIWFQNRRARFKTKQLEKDYDCLKANYDKLKSDFDNLLKEKEKLKNEVISLKGKLFIKDENQDIPNHDSANSTKPEALKAGLDTTLEAVACPLATACKQEEASSAKSDVFDSDSPHYTDGLHSSLLEPAGSSNVFEHEHSDFSQDDDDNLSRSLLPPSQFFPKLEDGSSNLGFASEDQLFCFWP